MRQYVARRLLLSVPTIIVVTLIIFSVLRLIPGDAATAMLSDASVTPDAIQELRTRMGLDKPIHEQLVKWVSDILHGDLGKSLFTKEPVFQEVVYRRMPLTLELTLYSVLLSVLIGVPLGVLSAVRQDSVSDYVGRSFAVAGQAVPYFWTATMVILYGSVWFGWTPPIMYASFTDHPFEHVAQFLLPSLLLGVYMSASVVRMTRTMLLEVLRQDYIRTAWAKGLREFVIIERHALRNSLIPVVTLIGVNITVALSGSVVLETIFGIPGVGAYMISSVLWRDYPAIQAVNLFLAIPIVFTNVLFDVITGWLNPQIRVQ